MSCIVDIKENSVIENFPNGIINIETPSKDISVRLSKCERDSEYGVIVRKSCKREYNVIIYTSESDYDSGFLLDGQSEFPHVTLKYTNGSWVRIKD